MKTIEKVYESGCSPPFHLNVITNVQRQLSLHLHPNGVRRTCINVASYVFFFFYEIYLYRFFLVYFSSFIARENTLPKSISVLSMAH